MTFNALVVEKNGESEVSAVVHSLTEDQLPAGNVTVAVEYRTVNYKVGLCMCKLVSVKLIRLVGTAICSTLG